MILTAPCPLVYIGIAIGAIIIGLAVAAGVFAVGSGVRAAISRLLKWSAAREARKAMEARERNEITVERLNELAARIREFDSLEAAREAARIEARRIMEGNQREQREAEARRRQREVDDALERATAHMRYGPESSPLPPVRHRVPSAPIQDSRPSSGPSYGAYGDSGGMPYIDFGGSSSSDSGSSSSDCGGGSDGGGGGGCD